MITVEQAATMTMGDIRSLRPSDFVLSPQSTRDDEAAYAALVKRFNALDPEFDTFLEHVRPDLMSSLGSPGVFTSRLERMSPFEVIHTWSVLTAGGIDDIGFITVIHALMGRKVAEVFGCVLPPVQATPQ